MNRTIEAAACCFLLALSVSGCGHRDGLTEIAGTITFDGQPVEKGNIMFIPVDGVGPSAAAIIIGGKYKVKIAPGAKRIKIDGFKVVGKQSYRPNDPTSRMVDALEQILPERYNTKSELNREIADGGGACDFALEK